MSWPFRICELRHRNLDNGCLPDRKKKRFLGLAWNAVFEGAISAELVWWLAEVNNGDEGTGCPVVSSLPQRHPSSNLGVLIFLYLQFPRLAARLLARVEIFQANCGGEGVDEKVIDANDPFVVDPGLEGIHTSWIVRSTCTARWNAFQASRLSRLKKDCGRVSALVKRITKKRLFEERSGKATFSRKSHCVDMKLTGLDHSSYVKFALIRSEHISYLRPPPYSSQRCVCVSRLQH